MNNKIIIILALLVFSFINNTIIAFDYLKDITSEVEPVVFYHKVEPRVEIEKPVKKYIQFILFSFLTLIIYHQWLKP